MQTHLNSNVHAEGDATGTAGLIPSARAHRAEVDHELRAGLFAIEVAATGVRGSRDQMPAVQVDALIDALVAEIGRVRALFEQRSSAVATFDLGAAIAPVVTCALASGLEVRAAVPTGLCVAGRADSTAQIIVALLDNVRCHAGAAPVEIRANARGAVTVLTVTDHGPGIDPSVADRLFERGVSGAASDGSGIGLCVARRLMEEQGGTITVGGRPGAGAQFTLRFRSA
jgi:signal transduction histidine kinase